MCEGEVRCERMDKPYVSDEYDERGRTNDHPAFVLEVGGEVRPTQSPCQAISRPRNKHQTA